MITPKYNNNLINNSNNNDNSYYYVHGYVTVVVTGVSPISMY